MSLKRQVVTDALVMLAFFATLFFMATSCKTTRPLSPIYPPGWTPPTSLNMATNAVREVLRSAIIGPPPPNVTLAADIDLTLPFDGVNLYAGFESQAMTLVATFGHTNVFPLNLPTNLPSEVEIRTSISWPPPYVVGSITLDDGTTEDFTNTFYESPGTQFIYVPTNCASIGLFTMSDGTTVVAGWADVPLMVESSADRITWNPISTVTNLGAFQVQVDQSQDHEWFRWHLH